MSGYWPSDLWKLPAPFGDMSYWVAEIDRALAGLASPAENQGDSAA